MTRTDKKMKCKDCLSYHPLSQWAGWCGLWCTVAISDQICMAWKEKPNAKDGGPDHKDAGKERI